MGWLGRVASGSSVALVVGLLPVLAPGMVALPLAVAVVPPSSVVLVSTADSFAAGASVSLTATASSDVAGSGHYGDGSPTITRTYDKDGRVATLTDAAGTRAYAYSTAGRLASIARTGTGPGTWSFTYNADGSLATQARPGTGQTETYSYDLAGHRTTAATPDGTLTFGYDADSNLTTTTGPTGTETRTLDPSGRLTGLDYTNPLGATLLSQTVTRAPDGSPTQITSTRGTATATTAYRYDGTGRLQGICDSPLADCDTPDDATAWWSYDVDGNRLTEKQGTGTGITTTWAYNDADQPTTRTPATGPATTYTVDPDGNVLSDGTTTATYNLDNRRTTAAYGGTTHTYTLDAAGHRVADATGASTTRYEWNPRSALPQLATVTGSTPQEYRYTPDGRAALLAEPGTVVGLAHDALGSVTDTITMGGTLGRSFGYTPFGATTTTVGAPTTPTGPTPVLGYQGMPGIGSDATWYTPARTYSTTDGAFTGSDPTFMSSGPAWNAPAVFANNNPLRYSDPTGMDAIDNIGQALMGGVDAIFTNPFTGESATAWFRENNPWFDTAGAADYCSDWYSGGHTVATIGSVALGGAGLVKGALAAPRLLAGARAGAGAIAQPARRLLAKIDWQDLRTALRSDTGSVNFSANARGRAAAKSVDEGVDLFRHVSPGELADIGEYGFRAGPNSLGGKWFAESGENASQWGRVLNNGEGSVVKVRVPDSFANQLMRLEKLDGIGPARYAEPHQLDMLNRFGWELP